MTRKMYKSIFVFDFDVYIWFIPFTIWSFMYVVFSRSEIISVYQTFFFTFMQKEVI